MADLSLEDLYREVYTMPETDPRIDEYLEEIEARESVFPGACAWIVTNLSQK